MAVVIPGAHSYKSRLQEKISEYSAYVSDPMALRMLEMGMMFVTEQMAEKIVTALDGAVEAYQRGDMEAILKIADQFNARPVIAAIIAKAQAESANSDNDALS